MSPHVVAQWYLSHQRALRNYLVKYTRLQRADAEDILVNVWIRVLRLVDEATVERPLSLLQRIAFNEAQEFCSKARHRLWHQELDEFSRMEDGAGRMPEQLIEHRDSCCRLMEHERTEHVFKAVTSLPERQCQAVVLHHFDGLTSKKTAQETGLSERQVMRSLALAHVTLRTKLAPSSEREHRGVRDHAKPAPRNAAGHAECLHGAEDRSGDEQENVEGHHACKRSSQSKVPLEITT